MVSRGGCRIPLHLDAGLCGLRAVEEFLHFHFHGCAHQNEFILELSNFALENNCFQFLTKFYQQIKGISMGASWAPAYACLHLGLCEEEQVFTNQMYLDHVHTWLRYIDGVLLIWRGTLNELHRFMEQLNVNDLNIYLTYTFDQTKISFLDLWLSISDSTISTCTFRIPFSRQIAITLNGSKTAYQSVNFFALNVTAPNPLNTEEKARTFTEGSGGYTHN